MPNSNPETPVTAPAALLPEPCPTAFPFEIGSCKDAHRVTLPETQLLNLGRIVQIDVTIKAVCPGKQVAASIILMEELADGSKVSRGAKHILIPAQEGTVCRDLTLRCIPFSLPEALDPDGITLCNERKFSAQVIANYVDTDFQCCDGGTTTV